jgi:hypothetical protein
MDPGIFERLFGLACPTAPQNRGDRARRPPALWGGILTAPATGHRTLGSKFVYGSPLLWCYFTVSSALSLTSPAVAAVIVALPTERPVATPRSVIVAFDGSLLSHTTPGVPTTFTGSVS